jgi:hypothetical protein
LLIYQEFTVLSANRKLKISLILCICYFSNYHEILKVFHSRSKKIKGKKKRLASASESEINSIRRRGKMGSVSQRHQMDYSRIVTGDEQKRI